ncbi:DUF3857 domain-containing protein [Dyadobacter luticola]|uniref:DUF3857 domain-containing protein n=1 Tax=Dyadobacter luticola TaxID=1979387 RepID=A0A5R9KW55_9BACT|nr:DUF3857 domain-containing protein [Dyadobacter luticola]TLV00474.1 DUF3857 domain-containing protein [Dyadobacter luticola]
MPVRLIILLFLYPFLAKADQDLSVGKIKPELLKGAHAVIRLSELEWEIKSKAEGRLSTHLIVTIFDESGEERYRSLYVGYDQFTKIKDIEGKLYDANGKLLKKLKTTDIQDFGLGLYSDAITDARMKQAQFGEKAFTYPYTIEFSYETVDRNMMFYPKWSAGKKEGTAIESAIFKIKAPEGFAFRYKEKNGAPPVKKSPASGSQVYEWSIANLPADDQTDEYPLPQIDGEPLVLTAPSDFEIQGYQGNFNSWEDMGKFYYTLNAGRDALPAATVEEIKTLVKNLKTDRAKVEAIYKWMQAKSRYVSIQLGIGGWQTIDAMTVAGKGYGDCKALTNFTLAALRTAGIKCHPALIKAGEEEKIMADFPSNQFNHVIACAVLAKDTMWLECTSQTAKPNFLGTFTGGRYALLVMPEGGKLVATPGYKSQQNVRSSKASVNLEENGTGQIEVQVRYAGLQQEMRQAVLYNTTKEEQKKWLINHINLPSLDLQRFELIEENEAEPRVRETLTMNVRNCATKTGTRLFVKPALLSRTIEMPTSSERPTDFYLPLSDYNFTDLDTMAYHVPANYKLETTLPAVKVSSAFGTYEMKAVLDNNRLVCYRSVVMTGGRYPSSDFPAWVDFLKKIRKADRTQVVFVENKP